MALQDRLSALISAIGADIKALQNRVDDRHNASITNQTIAGNTDTLIAGSVIDIPQGKIKVGTKYRLKFSAVKSAAGTAAPVITLRVGTLGTVADASRLTLTLAAQTAVADEGEIEMEVVFRQAGATALPAAVAKLVHRLAATGLSTSGASVVVNTGAAFDITGASLKISASLNVGASGSWTVNLASAELVNLTP